MGLLLLLPLSAALLASYVPPGSLVDAQRSFTIRSVALSIEPDADVSRDTNVTVRCRAAVSSSGQEALVRAYSVYKDGSNVYTKTTSSTQDFLYLLPAARVSNSGKYKCEVNIEGKSMASESKKLTVTGLSRPVLHLNNGVVAEGSEVTARCTAPGETGSIFFYFYDGGKEIHEERVNSNQVEARLRLSAVGIHRIHCDYTVLITPDSFKSEDSNAATVSVKELSVAPVLEVSPVDQVFEGDRLSVLCSVRDAPHGSDDVQLYLSQGARLLSSGGGGRLNHSMAALAQGGGLTFECRLEMGQLAKVATKTVLVTELFSAPTLAASPAEVFQKEPMTLTCRSESVAQARLDRTELTYALHPAENTLVSTATGVFSGKALLYDFNYTCSAQARGITKRSHVLTVSPKVSVSTPKISVYGKAVLGQPILILCQSDFGSLPINYTLLWAYGEVETKVVRLPSEMAIFKISLGSPKELKEFMCEAKNSNRDGLLSKRLNATVIEPLSHPTLTVLPALGDISEGDRLFLICAVKGTPPVTFRWYRVGDKLPLNTTTADEKHRDHQVPSLSKEHSGTYYCEAVNYANNVVRSEQVTIQVRMALWKKAVIGGVGLMVASLLAVVVCVLYFRSKRGKREAATELSVKPPGPKSDEALAVALTRDTEVYNAATVRVDRASVSVWSERKPEAEDEEDSSSASGEPDVEYTEVVHPRAADPARAPLRKGTDTVYSELQNAPHGAAEHHDYGSVQYSSLNGEQPESAQYHPEDQACQDLPVPVD